MTSTLKCPVCSDSFEPNAVNGGDIIPLWCKKCTLAFADSRVVLAAPLEKALHLRMADRQQSIAATAAALGTTPRTLSRMLSPARVYLRPDTADRWAGMLGKHPSEIWNAACPPTPLEQLKHSGPRGQQDGRNDAEAASG